MTYPCDAEHVQKAALTYPRGAEHVQKAALTYPSGAAHLQKAALIYPRDTACAGYCNDLSGNYIISNKYNNFNF